MREGVRGATPPLCLLDPRERSQRAAKWHQQQPQDDRATPCRLLGNAQAGPATGTMLLPGRVSAAGGPGSLGVGGVGEAGKREDGTPEQVQGGGVGAVPWVASLAHLSDGTDGEEAGGGASPLSGEESAAGGTGEGRAGEAGDGAPATTAAAGAICKRSVSMPHSFRHQQDSNEGAVKAAKRVKPKRGASHSNVLDWVLAGARKGSNARLSKLLAAKAAGASNTTSACTGSSSSQKLGPIHSFLHHTSSRGGSRDFREQQATRSGSLLKFGREHGREGGTASDGGGGGGGGTSSTTSASRLSSSRLPSPGAILPAAFAKLSRFLEKVGGGPRGDRGGEIGGGGGVSAPVSPEPSIRGRMARGTTASAGSLGGGGSGSPGDASPLSPLSDGAALQRSPSGGNAQRGSCDLLLDAASSRHRLYDVLLGQPPNPPTKCGPAAHFLVVFVCASVAAGTCVLLL